MAVSMICFPISINLNLLALNYRFEMNIKGERDFQVTKIGKRKNVFN